MGAGLDQPAIVAELERRLDIDPRSGVDRQARRLIADLVHDWAREADPMPDPNVVLGFQRESLERTIERLGGDPLDGVRITLLRRKIDQLGATTFRVGKAVLSGELDPVAGAEQGRALLDRAEELAAGISALDDRCAAEATALRRALDDPLLEALYLVEGGAMSHRLAREQADVNAAADTDAGPPPGLRP